MSIMKSEWHVSLDNDIATRLRDTVNLDTNIAIRSEKTLRFPSDRTKNPVYPAWNRICALMDRIEDIAAHINEMSIERPQHTRCAFSFLDLLNHSAVLIDCIYEIARIFDVNMSQYENSCEIFKQDGSDGRGSDKKYFEYLRSICSVHPFETNRHKQFQGSEFECCPYVIWNDGGMNVSGDLFAQIYLCKADLEHYKDLPIWLDDVVRYIEKMYAAIEHTIIPGVLAYQEMYRAKYRAVKLKNQTDFADYISYLRYLGAEGDLRLGCDEEYYIEEVCRFFEVEFTHPKNKRLLEKYQNALRLAIQFHHNCVQNVSYEGYENNGILFPQESYETTLLDLLLHPVSNSKMARQHGYALSKAYELVSPQDPHYYARSVMRSAHPFLEQYVALDEADSDMKYYVLIQLAQYADALRNKNYLNQNIPNELSYRMRRLKANGWEKLHTEKKRQVQSASMKTLVRLLEQYGG